MPTAIGEACSSLTWARPRRRQTCWRGPTCTTSWRQVRGGPGPTKILKLLSLRIAVLWASFGLWARLQKAGAHMLQRVSFQTSMPAANGRIPAHRVNLIPGCPLPAGLQRMWTMTS